MSDFEIICDAMENKLGMSDIVFHTLEKAHEIGGDFAQYWGWGIRGSGKTYPCMDECIQAYFDTADKNFEYGDGFAYVRRRKEEIVPGDIMDLFEKHEQQIIELSGGKFNKFCFYRKAIYMCYRTEDGELLYRSKSKLCKTYALSVWINNKGPDPFPKNKRTRIIFDEFLAPDGRYLEDEPKKLENVISTCNRLRPDPVLYCLGNPLCKWSPYFDKLGIDDVDAIEIGTIAKIEIPNQKRSIIIEYIKPDKTVSDAAESIFVFKNSNVSSLVNGMWEIADSPRLPKHARERADVVTMFFVEFHKKIFIGEILIIDDVELLHFKPSAYNTFNPKYYFFTDRTDINPLFIHGFPRFELTEYIMQIYRYARIYYSDDTTADRVRGWARSVGLESYAK